MGESSQVGMLLAVSASDTLVKMSRSKEIFAAAAVALSVAVISVGRHEGEWVVVGVRDVVCHVLRHQGADEVMRDFFVEHQQETCVTLDAVDAAGGIEDNPPAKIAKFAREQFTARGKAEEFAENLNKLSHGDLTTLRSLYCAKF